jgi:GNAT superfamily N-acetyltransferase
VTLFTLEPARAEDFEQLAELRISAMRESLTALGRFDPLRARARLASGFAPAFTRHVVVDGARVGFVVVKPCPEGLLLDHLYLRPSAQGRGLGTAVLAQVIEEADQQRAVLLVGALRGSAANRFYLRHGFVPASASDWDVHYRREPMG